MKNLNVKFWAFLALALVACGASEGSEEAVDQQEGEIALRKGNIDHGGVGESTTMMMADNPFSFQLDGYNAEDPFAIRPAAFIDTFKERLVRFDGYDDKADWTPEQIDAWSNRMATANYLLIDTSKPCNYDDPHTYLEIERSHMTGKAHETCGGRQMNEDVLDATANFLIRGPGAQFDDEDTLIDGVDQATQKSTDTFPYLAEMNPGMFD
jgi:hypothetical protein